MIEVKQKFINEGKRGSSHQCPVALAFLDATGLKQGEVTVGLRKASFYFKTSLGIESVTVRLSERVANFIRRFDSGKKVKPFSFPIPREV